jgi:glyoxylase-like metal-dependent hydrolase (beta-lactamase superfamily II)
MEIGNYRFEIIPDTEFWLDGGAMFGVVPRVLWERVCEPDDKNRIRLNMHCAFIETRDERVLIDTGIGEKWNERQTAMYGIDRERPFAESLEEITGYGPEDITIVVNTHLHFDHAGGNTLGDLHPQFPNARYFVSAREVEHAESPSERERASYRPDDWHPVKEAGRLVLKPDNYEVVPGLRMQTHTGHSKTMQTWRLDAGGKTIYGFADLIPTRHHLPLPWIMGYDLLPADTLEFKKAIIPEAIGHRWLCLFYHDPDTPLAWLVEGDNGNPRAVGASV